MELIKHIVDSVSGVIWNWPHAAPLLVVMLLGTGVFLTLRLGFINVRGFGHALRVVRGVYDDPEAAGDISHFQALTTALSATVGVGNIGGVATAIHYGGPGALFWMWLTALFGMTTKFTECTLALAYRRRNKDGTVSGGPMYYIERGLKWKPVALLFAACATVSSCGSGNAIQAFTMADSFRDQFLVPTWLTGGVSAALVAAVILGGIRRIGNVTSRIVPIMAALYITAALTALVLNAGALPGAISDIVSSAFTPSSALGGFAGATFVFTLTWGVKRGLFSNEAGQGSAPIAHAAARTDEPVSEGAVALLEPFIDTLMICSLTGLVIVSTGAFSLRKDSTYPLKRQSAITVVADTCKIGTNAKTHGDCKLPEGRRYAVHDGHVRGVRYILNHSFVELPRLVHKGKPANGWLSADAKGYPHLLDGGGNKIAGQLSGKVLQNASPLTAFAFDLGLARILPDGMPIGSYLVTICVFLFALSTAIGWSYYGDRAAQYLGGPRVQLPFKLIFVGMHLLGALFSLDIVWGFGDAALGLMSIPNLVAILALSGQVARMTSKYFAMEHVPFAKRADKRDGDSDGSGDGGGGGGGA